jgi:type I restriction enzyme M protein
MASLFDNERRKKKGKNNMTGKQQRDALQRQIWKIANDVRGAVDGWDFKQYVLGALIIR